MRVPDESAPTTDVNLAAPHRAARCTPRLLAVACLLLALAYLLLAVAGCRSETASRATWELDFEEPASRAAARAVDAVIWEGGCPGGEVLYRAEVRVGHTAPPPPPLPRGLYGFGGEARDEGCEPVARGCVSVRLPEQAAHVRVVLRPTAGPAACAPGLCRAGRCGGVPRNDAAVSPPAPDAEGPSRTGDPSGDPRDGGGRPTEADAGGPEDAFTRSPDAGSTDPDSADASTDPDSADASAGPDSTDASADPDSTDAGSADASADAGHAWDAGPPDCAGGDGHDGHCYRFEPGPSDWPSAEATCIAWGGHLVTLDDADEEGLMRTRWGPDLEVWIGLNDRASEGEWVWADGSDAGWRHWAPGAPDDGPQGQDCVVYQSDRVGWDDRNCRQGKAFICERHAS